MASGCIIWHGAVQSKGYPSVVVPGRGAHQPRKLPQVALIRTTKNGKPLFRVRWNYRDRSIDGKAYDEKDFRRETDALRFDAQKNPEQSSLTERVTVHEVCQHWLAEHVILGWRRCVCGGSMRRIGRGLCSRVVRGRRWGPRGTHTTIRRMSRRRGMVRWGVLGKRRGSSSHRISSGIRLRAS